MRKDEPVDKLASPPPNPLPAAQRGGIKPDSIAYQVIAKFYIWNNYFDDKQKRFSS
jgi:hypothetical protein